MTKFIGYDFNVPLMKPFYDIPNPIKYAPSPIRITRLRICDILHYDSMVDNDIYWYGCIKFHMEVCLSSWKTDAVIWIHSTV